MELVNYNILEHTALLTPWNWIPHISQKVILYSYLTHMSSEHRKISAWKNWFSEKQHHTKRKEKKLLLFLKKTLTDNANSTLEVSL